MAALFFSDPIEVKVVPKSMFASLRKEEIQGLFTLLIESPCISMISVGMIPEQIQFTVLLHSSLGTKEMKNFLNQYQEHLDVYLHFISEPQLTNIEERIHFEGEPFTGITLLQYTVTPLKFLMGEFRMFTALVVNCFSEILLPSSSHEVEDVNSQRKDEVEELIRAIQISESTAPWIVYREGERYFISEMGYEI